MFSLTRHRYQNPPPVQPQADQMFGTNINFIAYVGVSKYPIQAFKGHRQLVYEMNFTFTHTISSQFLFAEMHLFDTPVWGYSINTERNLMRAVPKPESLACSFITSLLKMTFFLALTLLPNLWKSTYDHYT